MPNNFVFDSEDSAGSSRALGFPLVNPRYCSVHFRVPYHVLRVGKNAKRQMFLVGEGQIKPTCLHFDKPFFTVATVVGIPL